MMLCQIDTSINNTIIMIYLIFIFINDRPTLVFPDTNSVLLICGTYNQNNSELSK